MNATKNKKERVGRILQMHANKREELDTVYSGDMLPLLDLRQQQQVIRSVMNSIRLS